MQLKPIHKEAIASALEKSVRYRVLNEPLETEDLEAAETSASAKRFAPRASASIGLRR